MKVAIATKCVFILGLLLATTYWMNSQCVISHNQWACNFQLFFITRNVNKNVTSNQLMGVFVNISKHYVCIDNNLFLAPPLQSPLIHKWKGERSRSKNTLPKNLNYNMFYFCRMAYSRSLEKSLDGVKDIEVSQNKKRLSSHASLTIVDKTRNRSSTQEKNLPLWLGFKAMNALNSNKGLPKESHKSVSELIKLGMYENEALECQDCIPSYQFVSQELWPNKNILE